MCVCVCVCVCVYYMYIYIYIYIYIYVTLWTPRDCRIQEPYGHHGIAEFNGQHQLRILTRNLLNVSLKTLTEAKLYPIKTLQRAFLTYVVTQLSFFIFPPNRVDTKNKITWSKGQTKSKRENGKNCGSNRSVNLIQKRSTLNLRRICLLHTKCENLNISTIRSQPATQVTMSGFNSYSLPQVQSTTVHCKWEKTCLNTVRLKLR